MSDHPLPSSARPLTKIRETWELVSPFLIVAPDVNAGVSSAERAAISAFTDAVDDILDPQMSDGTEAGLRMRIGMLERTIERMSESLPRESGPEAVAPADLIHAAQRALEWAAQFPVGFPEHAELIASDVYNLLHPLVDPVAGKYRASQPSASPASASDTDYANRNIRTMELANAVALHLGLSPAEEIPFEELTRRLRAPSPGAETDQRDADWVLWSNDHSAWWGPNRCGYSPNLLDAGVYTEGEAKRLEAIVSPRTGSNLPPGAVSDVAKSLRGLLAIAARSPDNVAHRLHTAYCDARRASPSG